MLYRFLSPDVPGFWPSNGFVEISLILIDMLVECKDDFAMAHIISIWD
jgi:hypothetical protein